MNVLLIALLVVALCVPIYLYAQPNTKSLRLAESTNLESLFVSEASYWLSEKYDGVRAFWDGTRLWTRQGNRIQPPNWFTTDLPKIPLDGELWLGRGQFEALSGIVRTQTPVDTDWQKVKFMVFDLPEAETLFEQRQQALSQLIREANLPHLIQVKQLKIEKPEQLQTLFKQLVNAGAEGIMLNSPGSRYKIGRDKTLLKLKPFSDDEAEVLAHIEGRGKYQTMLGAILVKNRDGLIFKIGSGFSDEERLRPPEIGSIISYRYSGLTNSGKPRFAVYLRQRQDLERL